MYQQGLGVEQDYTEAFKWYQKAADQGYANAQHNLGFMYYQGYGLPKNNIQAYALFGVAAANGSTEAIQARITLEEQFTIDELEEARQLARELWEKYGIKNNAKDTSLLTDQR